VGCTDSLYVSQLDTLYRKLKTYHESRLNYALLDRQINLLNSQLEKAWNDSYQRSSPCGIIRKEILSKKPDETDQLILDGIKFSAENKQDKAYEYFKKAVEKEPARLNYYYFVIMDELEFVRDTVKALETINKVISTNKNIFAYNPYSLRAWIYISQKQYSLACDELNHVLEKDTNNQQALFNRGHLKTEMKDFAGSVSDYQRLLKCLRLKPFRTVADSAMILNNIGWNYYLSKEYELCTEYAGKSLLLKPNDPFTLDTRGSGYFGLGEYEKCIDEMTKAIKLNKSNQIKPRASQLLAPPWAFVPEIEQT